MTHWVDYLKYAKFLGGDKDRQYGSSYEWTIYWQIVGSPIYYSWWFPQLLKATMLFINVYYFFFRRWCLPQCFTNLFNTFSQRSTKLTWSNSRLAFELLLICYIGGV